MARIRGKTRLVHKSVKTKFGRFRVREFTTGVAKGDFILIPIKKRRRRR